MDEQPQEVIQPVVEKKFPTIALVLICVLGAGAVFGAAGYFGASYLLAGEKTPLQDQIKTLTTEKTDLQTKLDEATKAAADAVQKATEEKPITLRYVYSPETSFSDAEKTSLSEKVVNAYLDFYSVEFGLADPVQVVIIKKDVLKKDSTTLYFEFLHKTGYTIYSYKVTDSIYPEWYPLCKFTDCRDVPQKFAEKYPALITKAKSDMSAGAGLRTDEANKLNPTPTPKQ